LEEVVVVWEREGVPVVQDLRGCHNGRFVEASIVVVVKGLLLQGCCRAALQRGSKNCCIQVEFWELVAGGETSMFYETWEAMCRGGYAITRPLPNVSKPKIPPPLMMAKVRLNVGTSKLGMIVLFSVSKETTEIVTGEISVINTMPLWEFSHMQAMYCEMGTYQKIKAIGIKILLSLVLQSL
jgi:hypothetical protein